jgi:Secretion system C-terminal sorting domain
VKNKSGTNSTLLLGTDYTLTGGKYVFQSVTDSIYVEMTNTSFPDLTGTKVLRTTCTKVGTGSGIEAAETTGVKIYTRYRTLFIDAPYNTQISIFDINGRLLLSKTINNGENSIPLNNAGIYLVKLTGNKNSFTRKVVIE